MSGSVSTLSIAIATLVGVATGCGHQSANGTRPDGGPGTPSGGSGGPTGGPGGPSGAFPDSGMPTVGQVTAIQTSLHSLPPLADVSAALNDDSVSIFFGPVEGALDYRVYPLPNDSDITVATDGHVAIHNAVYRCSGDRETASPRVDNGPDVPGSAINTQVDQVTVGGFMRTLADATLGYVYTQPAAGLVPVYVLGESAAFGDSTCFFARWAASRVKKYTTSDAERAQLISGLARDDGIAFYVPAMSDSTTKQIYLAEDGVGGQFMQRFYFADGPEANAHATKTAAFSVLAAQAAGTLPLMRVFYSNRCGWSHDELAVGKEWFNRIYKQGDALPWWSLLWTGITGPTTLVVEALDSGCPFQGLLSPKSIPSVTGHLGAVTLVHPAYATIDDLRAASSTTEVFINGQHDPAGKPKAIARSFINVTPNAHAKMDFFADFSPKSAPETFTDVPCGAPGGNCFQTWRQVSPTFDQIFMNVESAPGQGAGLYAAGPVLGELWVNYADVASDTNGKFRLTPKQKANIDASTFLHVTMEVDAYSTARRYPQILISDQDAPVQYALPNGHTLVVETIAEVNSTAYWPVDYQLQICNKRTWDVNDQCPAYDLYHIKDSAGNVVHLAPNDEVGEHASADHRAIFDVYASTQRAYLFLDGSPYACANLPAVGIPSGPVTVTYGDVIYHSAVDLTFGVHKAHMQVDAKRHFDNLGFSSGVPAPGWDESRLPCAAPISP